MIVGVIEPMLSSANSLETFFEKRRYIWDITKESHIEGDLKEILGDDLELFRVSSGGHKGKFYLPTYLPRLSKGFHQTYYRNFRERNPQLCKRIEDFDNKLPDFNSLLFDLARDIVSHRVFNEVLRSKIESDEASAEWNEIRLGCDYFAFMKLIGSGEPPSKLYTGFGAVDKKAVERWETDQKFLMEEIGKSLAGKADRILRECDAFKECLAQIKEALLEESYNYKTNFRIKQF